MLQHLRSKPPQLADKYVRTRVPVQAHECAGQAPPIGYVGKQQPRRLKQALVKAPVEVVMRCVTFLVGGEQGRGQQHMETWR